ncbi:putative D-tyrosyl-tRNA deacylase [Polychytrium aggregatum]|uniref:putative D-tyrosyl-tRNA deacylase n=1 Tax=Polychytrium aggregatum TaxID=110093 RepID=UPI0022FEF08F|nr:putative D-tyrosyl-tRNA deacylase [Polychytrium aggregatum]KAI9208257.1 putative D-tyrosyl-tRNA deacylase [Polychytrium aggregatum]
MRVVLQRVSSASVQVDGQVVSEIGRGICALVGITVDDQEADLDYCARKLSNIRVFEDQDGAFWKKSVMDLDLEILCVSQFTLYANTFKGSKPDFHLAMKSTESRDMYELFLNKLRASYNPERIKDGVFGAMMQVSIVNEGPVTLTIDSRIRG